MSDDELISFAQEFREGVLDGRPSRYMCAMVCEPLVGLLRFHGVEAETVTVDLGDCNHVWIKLADGRALDPTADQFNWINSEQMPPVYLGNPTKLHDPSLMTPLFPKWRIGDEKETP